MGGADKVKKLAAPDSHFLLNNFLIKNFGVVVLVVVLVFLAVVFRTGSSSGKPLLLPVL